LTPSSKEGGMPKPKRFAIGKLDYKFIVGTVKPLLYKDAVQSVCKQWLCLHFGIQNIEFYSTTIYIFIILDYNKL
jgi:hypothetical protein